ncbi:hypothetical protein PVAG01_04442 [Phlyctema vagabunda]|uniref:Uncharacterized protein n=1 Tax=Phlyctema vagabunda TaxID=108571 RepID=A0ABR4PP80_9HELO
MSTFEPSSEQLQRELRASTTRSLSSRRPILTHLNADTTWLLSVPYPSPSTKQYFHILIDPWLRGPQSDVAAFFSTQWHTIPSAVQSIAEIEEAIRDIEAVAVGKQTASEKNDVGIDAVVVSHEFTDHMHELTLREIASSVPVFATTKAAALIRSWRHFEAVFEIPRFAGEWRDTSCEPLPLWLGIGRLAVGQDMLYYHSGILITFQSQVTDGDVAEAVIYTPHGISPELALPVAAAAPRIRTLGLLHGLQDITLGAQLNMGAHNGLRVQRIINAKYWVGTHDEVKRGGGLVSWWLKRKAITLQEALEKEADERQDEGVLADVNFEQLGNGESLILE